MLTVADSCGLTLTVNEPLEAKRHNVSYAKHSKGLNRQYSLATLHVNQFPSISVHITRTPQSAFSEVSHGS